MKELHLKSNKRPVRANIGGRKNVLTCSKVEPGYVYRFVNDIDDNVLQKKELGYEFVDDPVKVGDKSANVASNIGRVISKPVGGGITAYLMRCKESAYNERSNAKKEYNQEIMQAIFKDIGDTPDREGNYGAIKEDI